MTSRSLKQRMGGHYYSLKNPKSNFHIALKKYGPSNFTWEILDSSAKNYEELKQLEIKYIAELKPEYNMTAGGDTSAFIGIPIKDETKLKISETKKGKSPWNKGIRLSEDQKKNMKGKSKGRVLSQETRHKMSLSHLGIPRTDKAKASIKKSWEIRRSKCLSL
jgi:group I intron endonuclease